jgi:uncharacterized protein
VIPVPVLLWDASALAKRFVPEVGSRTVDALLTAQPRPSMIGTVIGYAEAFSILLRHRNRGTISAATFLAAKSLLRLEVVEDPSFRLLTVDDAAFLAGLTLMERYNLNATDAAILALFLRYVQALPSPGPGTVLVASDHRLLSAAATEGLVTLDPAVFLEADVPAFLHAL